MEKKNGAKNFIQYKIYGKYALFTNPITKIGGEKSSYHLPTYEALRGITEGIYWKPTFEWIIDKVRVMKPIQTETKSIKLRNYASKNSDLAMFTYLSNVEYRVFAHFEWDESRPDLEKDRDELKHFCLANRYLNKGGKRDVFLGARECVAYVEPCDFDEGEGFYDQVPEINFGAMFHSFTYPKTSQDEKLMSNLWTAVMRKGVVDFVRPEECPVKRTVRNYAFNKVEVSPEREKCEAEVLE